MSNLLVFINRNEVVKEESASKNIIKVSGIKSTHLSKIFPRVKKANT